MERRQARPCCASPSILRLASRDGLCLTWRRSWNAFCSSPGCSLGSAPGCSPGSALSSRDSPRYARARLVVRLMVDRRLVVFRCLVLLWQQVVLRRLVKLLRLGVDLRQVALLRTVILRQLAMLLRLVVDVHLVMLLGAVLLRRLISAARLVALRHIGSHRCSHAPRVPCFCSAALCPPPPRTPWRRSTTQQAARAGRKSATGSAASRARRPHGVA